MTSSLPGAPTDLVGAQRPRLWSAPEFTSTSAEEVIDLAGMAGLVLDDWQQWELRHALSELPEWSCTVCLFRSPTWGVCPHHPNTPLIHPWAAPTVCLIVPRQNGKNATVEARELGGLYVLGERRLVHSAHLQDTATVQFERLLGRIEDTPELKKRMLKAVHGKGSEAIILRSGQRIEFKTRTAKSKRGDSIDLVVFDEAYELPEAAISAMIPTLSARPNTQTVYTSSAVDQQKHDNGVALARQRERGLAKRPGIFYAEWSIEGDDPSRVPDDVACDPAMWAQANPGLGIRLSLGNIRREYDGEMGHREFAVERLGVGDWPSTSDLRERVIALGAWRALTDAKSQPTGRVVFAYDVCPDHSAGSIGVAGARKDGLLHVELVEHRAGSAWIPERMAGLMKSHRNRGVWCDPAGPAGSLLPELRSYGIEPELAGAAEHGRACGLFLTTVNARGLRHRGERDLEDAVDGAARRRLGEAWLWDRTSSDVDISPLVAVTLATWGARASSRRRVPRVIDLHAESRKLVTTDVSAQAPLGPIGP